MPDGSVRFIVIDDNHIDILIPGAKGVSRTGLMHHFDPKKTPLQAEFGIAILVEVDHAGRTWRYLFDQGLSGPVLMHNMAALGIDPGTLDCLVLSHGHPDHYGGAFAVLDAIDHPIPYYTHEDAFLPRNIAFADGCVSPYYNFALRHDALQAHGASVVLGSDPIDIGPGVLVSGVIPRVNDEFEGPNRPVVPGASLTQLRDGGHLVPDQVMDELALYVTVPGLGFVTLTGCAHAGPVNSMQLGKSLLDTQALGLIGGMHLGMPGVLPTAKEMTVDAMRELEIGFVMPGHCTGADATSYIRAEMPEVYIECSVGTTLDPHHMTHRGCGGCA